LEPWAENFRAKTKSFDPWTAPNGMPTPLGAAVQKKFSRHWETAQQLKPAAFSRIALQLGLAASTLLLAVLILVGGVVLREQRRLLMNEMQERCDLFVKSLSIVAREAYYPKPDLFFLGYMAEQTLKEEWMRRITLYDRKGGVILLKERAEMPVSSDRIELSRPILLRDVEVGRVEMVFSLEPVKEAQRTVAFRMGAVALIAVGAGLLLIVAGVPLLVKPIFELSQAAHKIGAGDFDTRVDYAGKNEIGMLARTFNDMAQGLKERELIRTSFGRYFSPNVAKAILEGSVSAAGERKAVTLLLMDIRGFTTLTEKLAPEETVRILNDFYAKVVEIIHRYQGTVDKFMGDAVLAVFGAPVSFDNHAFLGMTCAMEILKSMEEFNAVRAGAGRPPLKVGIALNTGEVVAGNLGTQERSEYTVIGDAVNTVARMEGLNKRLGTTILVSAATRASNKEWFAFQPLGKHTLRGRKEPVELYTVTVDAV
jgi:class 3 adenylate cyclase